MKKLAFIKRSNGNHWVGDGFPVQNIFSYRDIHAEMSPFLLMDYAGPARFEPTEQRRGKATGFANLDRQHACFTSREAPWPHLAATHDAAPASH